MSAVATLTSDTITDEVYALSIDERADIISDEGHAIAGLFTEWQESTTSANAAQVAAGMKLNKVHELRGVLFTDEEGEELSTRGAESAFRSFWQAEGLTKDFVSRARAAAGLSDIVGEDTVSTFSAEMVKKLLPVANEVTASGKPRKLEVRQQNVAKVLAKAEEMADKDNREIAGRDIAAAREELNIVPAAPRSTEHTLSVRAVVRAVELRENTILSFVGVQDEDIQAIYNFMTVLETAWSARLVEMASDAAESDSADE